MRFWTSGIRIVWSLRFQQGFCLPDNADRDCSELGVPDAADRVLHSPRKTEPETDSWVLELPATDTIYVKSAALFMTAFSAVRVKFTANP